MRGVEDAGLVVEARFSGGVDRALLYAQNLTEAILQKLRNYRIRVAVVCPGRERAIQQPVWGDGGGRGARGPLPTVLLSVLRTVFRFEERFQKLPRFRLAVARHL